MIPWGQIYRNLALAYPGWTFDDINNLTLYQVHIAMGAGEPSDGTQRMSLDEAVARGLLKHRA